MFRYVPDSSLLLGFVSAEILLLQLTTNNSNLVLNILNQLVILQFDSYIIF